MYWIASMPRWYPNSKQFFLYSLLIQYPFKHLIKLLHFFPLLSYHRLICSTIWWMPSIAYTKSILITFLIGKTRRQMFFVFFFFWVPYKHVLIIPAKSSGIPNLIRIIIIIINIIIIIGSSKSSRSSSSSSSGGG